MIEVSLTRFSSGAYAFTLNDKTGGNALWLN